MKSLHHQIEEFGVERLKHQQEQNRLNEVISQADRRMAVKHKDLINRVSELDKQVAADARTMNDKQARLDHIHADYSTKMDSLRKELIKEKKKLKAEAKKEVEMTLAAAQVEHSAAIKSLEETLQRTTEEGNKTEMGLQQLVDRANTDRQFVEQTLQEEISELNEQRKAIKLVHEEAVEAIEHKGRLELAAVKESVISLQNEHKAEKGRIQDEFENDLAAVNERHAAASSEAFDLFQKEKEQMSSL